MSDVYPKIRLAAVQASPVFLDREASVQKACDLITEAGKNGADFIGFPENFIPGHPVWYGYEICAEGERAMHLATELYKNSVEIPSDSVNKLCHAAADAGVYVVMGLTEKKAGQTGTLWNTQLFIDRAGRIIGKHQKLHPTMTEQLVHTGGSGKSLGTVPTEFGPVSGLICGENTNPFAVGLLACEYTRIHVAAWPPHFMVGHCSPMKESIEIASRNIAHACKAFVISAAGTVNDEMVDLMATCDEEREILKNPGVTGCSIIVDPTGNIIAGPLPGDKEDILYADANLEQCITNHLVHDFGGWYNRPDILRLFVNDAEDNIVTRVVGNSGFFKPEQEVLKPDKTSTDCVEE